MGTTSDSATRLTLISALCGSETDEAAWQVFFQRYQPMIRGWCVRHGLQEADVDDVTQKVLQRVFTKIGTYDSDRGGFRGWLKTVVENAIKDFRRSRGRRPGDQGAGDSDVAELLNAIAEPQTVGTLVEQLDTSLRQDLEEILARVERAVQPDTMRAFRMTVLEGQSISDVAAQLGKSYAAVCMAMNRVKEKLRAEGGKLGE